MAANRIGKMEGISIYRFNALLVLVILSSVILYFGKSFLVPLFFSFLLVMLLFPVCKKLETWGLSRVLSTFAGIIIILFFIALIVGIIVAQGVSFAEDWPQMQQKAQEFLTQAQQWIQERYGVAPQEQISYLQKGIEKMSQSGSSSVSKVFSYLMGFLTGLVLVLLYFFFIMWKREKYVEFILKLVKDENREKAKAELKEIRKVASGYLIGRLISMIFLAVIYIIGFSIIGLPNAILLALVAVIPTIVPYVGAFIGGFFPLAMALLTGSADMVLPTIITLVVAQILDNNIIEPLVEGESLDISPIFTIIAIVLGELFWGVAGMILFLPLFAMLKIICDHIPALHPYGFLLNNELDEPRWLQKVKKLFKKK